MPPAARVSDMHTCPMFDGPKPHVGGPILPPGCPTVLIGYLPAARVTDMATCVGPPDMIAMGSTSVMIGGLPAARLGDPTAHGGVIVLGCFTVMIGAKSAYRIRQCCETSQARAQERDVAERGCDRAWTAYLRAI